MSYLLKTSSTLAATPKVERIVIDRPPIQATSFSAGLNKVFFWSGIVAVAVIVVAGFQYVTSAGNSEKVKKAKNAILFAVIGLVVVLMAFAIVNFVIEKV